MGPGPWDCRIGPQRARSGQVCNAFLTTLLSLPGNESTIGRANRAPAAARQMLPNVSSPKPGTPPGGLSAGEAEREQILDLLGRILHSPAFHGSRRCTELLEYCVTKHLAGDMPALKERVIGAALFGREPDYDTSNDAIVRVTANEVRKRLALFYAQAGGSESLRIELAPGSYVPNYIRAETGSARTEQPQPSVPVQGQAEADREEPAVQPRRREWRRGCSHRVP